MVNNEDTKQRLIVIIMGQNCERTIGMALESVKDADDILYLDGGSIDNSIRFAKEKGCKIIINEYNQEDKAMNGKQRNFYLKYLKENYKGWYCLVLDADEVLSQDGIRKIKEFLNYQ